MTEHKGHSTNSYIMVGHGYLKVAELVRVKPKKQHKKVSCMQTSKLHVKTYILRCDCGVNQE